MKAVLPIQTDSVEGLISLKFARSKFFALIDRDKRAYEIIESPFAKDQKNVGKNVFTFLIEEKKVDTFIAFELGLKVQQLTTKKKIQLIILNEKDNTFKNILQYMKLD